MTTRISNRLVWAVSVLAVAAAALGAKPELFEDRTLAEAQAASAERERILIVKGTAVWCGPCKMMDRTTWVDEGIVAWIREHGLAIAVDVDESPDDAEALGIRAMPTILAFRGEEELGRFVGYRDAADTLEFLEAVEAGTWENAPERPRRAGRPEVDPEREAEAERRLDVAREYLRAGRHAEATDEFEWLWSNLEKDAPSMSGVRVSFMLGDMGELARAHPPAMERFLALRAEHQKRLEDGTGDSDDLSDWVSLSIEFGLGEDVIAWADRVRGDAEGARSIAHAGVHAASLFLEHDRLDLFVLTEERPADKMAMNVQFFWPMNYDPSSGRVDGDAWRRREVEAWGFESANWYAALMRADRFGEAGLIVQHVFGAAELPEREAVAASFVRRVLELGVEPPRAALALAPEDAIKPEFSGGPGLADLVTSPTLMAAEAASEADGRLVLVWLRETSHANDEPMWRDEGVRAWLSEHARLVAIDPFAIGGTRRSDAAMAVMGRMPALVARRGGVEIGRHLGPFHAPSTMRFLRTVDAGETPMPRRPMVRGNELVQALTPLNNSLWAYLETTSAWLRAGEYDRATPAAVWLWENMIEFEAMSLGVRVSFFVNEIEKLASAHEPAAEAFEAIRKRTADRLRSPDGSFQDLEDWVVLSLALGRDDEVVAWADRVAGDGGGAASISRVRLHVREPFIEASRWDLLLLTTDDPAARVARDIRALREEAWRNVFTGREAAEWYVAVLRTGGDADAILDSAFGAPAEALDGELRRAIAWAFAGRLRELDVEVPATVRALIQPE